MEKECSKVLLVKNAMLATQRYPWEQGTCAQALYEMGDHTTAIAMAHDAVLRAGEDGRLALMNESIVVTDPAANGEMVWRAYEMTGQEMYKKAAEGMRDYLLYKAPRTREGIICHMELEKGQEEMHQIWADSCYMAPPFLAAIGCFDEAEKQMDGYLSYLMDPEEHLLYHRYDAGKREFLRKKLWATGSGWTLMGLARMIDLAKEQKKDQVAEKYIVVAKEILDAMLSYQAEDGRFHDILNEDDSFLDGASAMMVATTIYRGIAKGWLSKEYATKADLVCQTMTGLVDEYGIIHGVAGCPHFMAEGTSAESMASFLMMYAWKEKLEQKEAE